MSTATAALVPPITVAPARAAAPPRLISGPLLRMLLVELGAMTGFYLLVAVVPMYAASRGAGGFGAGLSTGVLMLASVAGELVTPWLATRLGYRRMLVAGLVLLGLPALALPATTTPVGILAVCAVRGIGFAVVVVAIGALVAAIVPAERRGEGLGVIGVAGMLPGIVALPLGVWLVAAVGFTVAFAVGALACVLSVAAVVGLPDPAAHADEPLGVLAALRDASIARPAIVFATTAVASGVVVTFLPGAVGAGHDVAALGLLVQAAAATLTRWLAGRLVDRRGPGHLLVIAVLLTAAGMACLVLVSSIVAVLVGMALFGAGFGAAQSASLTAMLAQVPASAYGAVSAVWNLAYDLGWGVGAAGIGLVVAGAGFPVAFAVTAVLTLAVSLLARSRRAAH